MRPVPRVGIGLVLALVSTAALAGGPTHVGGTIASNTAWTVDGSPYVFDAGVTVSSGVTLTVEAGVVVKALGDRWLQVLGTLKALGTESLPITFTSLADDTVAGDTNSDGGATSPARGDWGGIGFKSTSTANELAYAVVRYAGRTDWGYYHFAGIYTETRDLSLAHTTVSDNAQQGLRSTEGGAAAVSDSTFVRNEYWAIYCDDVDCTGTALRRNAAASNGVNGIRVTSTLDGSATWEDALPIVIEGGVTVGGGATLTLAPGAIVKAIGGAAYLRVYGSLHADATGSAPIRLTAFADDSAGGDTNGDGTASAPARGAWGGVGFYGGSTGNVLANASVRWAGGVDWGFYHNAGIYTQVSALALDHVTVDQAWQDGLSIAGAAAPVVTNCALTNNARWAVFVDDPDGTGSGLRGNAAAGNGINGIRVNGTLDTSAIWEDGMPFVIENVVAVAAGAELTITPGRVVKANPGSTRLVVYGTLDAQGTSEAHIVFTSLRDDTAGGDTNGDGTASVAVPGDWQGLGILAGSTGNVLSNANVRYGGRDDWGYYHYATLWIDTSSLVATAVTVSNSAADGLGTWDTAAPQFTGCSFTANAGSGARLGAGVVTLGTSSFTNNGGWAIYCEGVNATRALSGNTASGNHFNAIRVAGNLEGAATWESAIPVVLDSAVSVMPGVTLTVQPGAVVKSTAPSGNLSVFGTLSAPGTAGAPITFTAFADDAAGGDTNGDGTTAPPGRGAWGGVGFRTGSAGNTLSHVVIRYGGGVDWGYYHYADLYSEVASLSVTDSTIAHSSGDGFRGTATAAPSFERVTFTANTGWAGYFDDPDGTTATLRSNAMTGNGANGWRVGGTLDGNATWNDAVPFVIDSALGIGTAARLDIAPGLVVKFIPAINGRIVVYGTLSAVGTEEEPITMTSLRDDSVGGDTNGDGTATAPAAGDLAGLGFYTGSKNCELRHTALRYGGSLDWGFYHNANLYSETTGLVIADSTIADSAALGIYYPAGTVSLARSRVERCTGHAILFGAAAAGSIDDCPAIESFYYEAGSARIAWSGNTFTNWGRKRSRALPDEVASITSGSNTFYGVTGAALELSGGWVVRDGTWSDGAGPLVVIDNVGVAGTDGADARTTLTIGPGTTLRFVDGRGLYIGDGGAQPGGLIADGRLAGGGLRPIVFTSDASLPVTGAWPGIEVRVNGRFSIHGVAVQWADHPLLAYGPFDAIEDFSVNRANTGLSLVGIGAGQQLDRLHFENCTIGMRGSNAPVVIRNSELLGHAWGAYNDTPGAVIDARQNWWGAPDGPSGHGPGTGSPVSAGILFEPWLDKPQDDGDGVPADSGHGYPFPCTCGRTTDCDDNCPRVANASQKDSDCDGVGDACDTNPVLTVSSDPADEPDFDTIQAAVDATTQSGSRIEIFPGLGPYRESVRVDRYQVYSFERREADGSAPVVVDGGGNPAFYVQNSGGTASQHFDGLTLRGGKGIQALVDVDARRVTFEAIAAQALDLPAGTHRLDRCTVLPGIPIGAAVGSGARLDVARTTFRGCTDASIVAAGAVHVENTVVAGGNGGADGIRVPAGGTLTVRYTTIAGNTGWGIEGAGGSVTIDRSILYQNTLGDLTGVACTAVSWSDVGSVDCSAVGGNLHADPLLEPDGTLRDGSPCLDHGPSPMTYDGTPPTDLAGAPRLVDYDGSGLAQNDCGAYEKPAPLRVPGEVQHVVFVSRYTLAWDVEPSAARYELYRGDAARLGYAYYGACLATTVSTQYVDSVEPAAGKANFYLVTARTAAGREGTLGAGTNAERSNYDPCP